ncbi:MAG: formate/nitrite transporter family protein [Thermovenabulum sp.]|uniref:formate/nitrite transporter family protein n=1 Tax=Thermovenabulum sp. TaxID=3100335 RepID=UPI003C7D4E61
MEKRFLTPKETAKVLIDISEKKSQLAFFNMVLLGIFAGVFIGFAGQGSITVMQTLRNFDIGFMKFMGAIVFTVGLMMVVICGAELFTGNNLMVIGLLDKRITLAGLLRNWLTVYFSNFIGSVLLVILVVKSNIFTKEMTELIFKMAFSKISLTFSEAVIRGILCNILVVLAVWMATASQDGVSKLFSCFFPIMLFVLSGYEHSIANMYFIPLAKFLGAQMSWGDILIKNIIPVTLGNIIGGAVIVPLVYYCCYICEDKKRDLV